MSILLAILGFIVGMLVLVIVHEFGHYWVAKKLGVKILRFSVGFGKPLFLWRRGVDQTEWVLASIPLGGFVRMLDEQEGEVSAQDLPRAFNRQALWKRTLIVLAGPVANLILAFLLYAGMLMWGVPQLTPKIHTVQAGSIAAQAGFKSFATITSINEEPVSSWSDVDLLLLLSALEHKNVEVEVNEASTGVTSTKHIDFSQFDRQKLTQNFSQLIGLSVVPVYERPVVGGLLPNGRAAKAGMQADDLILAVDGVPVGNWEEMAARIEAKAEKMVEIKVLRNQAEVLLNVQPEQQIKDGKKVGRIGISPKLDEEAYKKLIFNQRLGFTDASIKAWQQGRIATRLTLKMMAGMLFGDVSTNNISGPVGIASIAGDSIKAGVPSFIGFLVIMSLSLGIMNLLPIPVLDGGHLVYYLVEAISGKPLSERTLLIAQRLGIALLGLLTLLAFYNDFYRLLSH